MQKQKRIFYTELAYLLGIIFLAFGTALMEKGDFGMSMVVAPAYLLYLKISQYASFFTFGMAEYLVQALLLLVLTLIMRRFKWSYLFSFVTAVIYGILLDLSMSVTELFEIHNLFSRLSFFLFGLFFCSLGVAFMFHTYISAEAYEQFVKEIAVKIDTPISKVKTIYDCASCAIGILLSFLFFGFGQFEGIKFGTIFCALVNGFLIGQFSQILERNYHFKDCFALKKYFE